MVKWEDPVSEGMLAALPASPCANECPLVLVCRKCKGHEKVVDALSSRGLAAIRTVRCQKVCEGPVIGLRIEGRMEWFERMGGSNSLDALDRLIAHGPLPRLPKVLRKRLCKERSGRPPR